MKVFTHPGNLERHKQYLELLKTVDSFLAQAGYQKVDVPVLSPVLIPESYLEVFETEYRYMDNREKLYLIPSSELFLKRLLAHGVGSCYTLMKNYRNAEAPSSRHLSEFTMLEMYKVNAHYFEIAEDIMGLLRSICKKLYNSDSFTYQGKTISLVDYEKITVKEAFAKYAQMSDIYDTELFFKEAREKGYEVEGFTYSEVWSQIYAQEVEPNLGMNGKPTIIYEYPRELAAVVEFDEKKNVAYRFEIYIAGIELGNCGSEVSPSTNFEEMAERLQKEYKERKQNNRIMFPPDTEFVVNLRKMKPASGIAMGIDRIAMLFTDAESVKDLQLITYE